MKFRNPETGEMFKSNVTLRGQVTELEVVEDSKGVEIDQVKKEDTNMDKPRICEVLGVEVGEPFKCGSFEFELTLDGDLKYRSDSCRCYADAKMLIDIINNPNRIRRKPRWTEQESERAKAIRIIYPGAVILKRWPDKISVCGKEKTLTSLSIELFPSLRLGETVTLDEIIGGAQ